MTTAIAMLLAVPLLLLARRWEHEGRRERWVALVVGFLLVECLLYPVQSDVPLGAFRIALLGGNLRTVDYLVVLGVVGRMTTTSLPRRIASTSLVWFLAFAWFATAVVRGLLAGHDVNLVLFSTGSLVGLFGSMVLVAGCDPRRLVALVRSRAMVPLAALLVLLIPNHASDRSATFLGTDLGILQVDTASVFVALGILILLVEWSSQPRRRLATWAAVPMLLTPLAIPQRATLVQLAVSVLVVGWAMTQYEWSGRINVRRLRLVQGALAVVAVVMVVMVLSLRDRAEPPFAEYYEETFTSENQAQSAQARRDAFSVGVDEWIAAWPYGHGLGHSYRIERPFAPTLQRPATFDNVPLDVLVRTGLVGLGLSLAAVALTWRDGIRVWRRHADGAVAALALGAVAVLAGLVSKALFESVLEKGKIAILFGCMAGVIAAAARNLREPVPPTHDPPHVAANVRDQGEPTWT